MKSKFFFYAWIGTAITLFLLNGLFHGLLVTNYFDRNLAALAPVMKSAEDLNLIPIIILELLLDFALVTIITLDKEEALSLKHCLIIATLFYASAALTFNLANSLMFISWPLPVTIADVLWHAATGVVAGWIIYKLYNLRFRRRIPVR